MSVIVQPEQSSPQKSDQEWPRLFGPTRTLHNLTLYTLWQNSDSVGKYEIAPFSTFTTIPIDNAATVFGVENKPRKFSGVSAVGTQIYFSPCVRAPAASLRHAPCACACDACCVRACGASVRARCCTLHASG